MKHVVTAFVLLWVCAVSAEAQDRSHWGAAAGFIPKWDTKGWSEEINKLVIDSDYLGFTGSEFRIGIVRGRRLSGDWGVSFVRRTFDAGSPQRVEQGSSCLGGSTSGNAPLVVKCTDDSAELTPNNLRVTGVEVNKFIAFVTISERVQIGLNVAGGIGKGDGVFTSQLFRRTYTCTFPPGAFPSGDDPCENGVRSNDVTASAGSGEDEPFTNILAYDGRNLIPLGKLEIGVSVIVAPRIKVRASGGLNYPGQATFGITGLYFFGSD